MTLDQETTESGEKVGVKEEVSQIFSQNETILDGIEDTRTITSPPIHKSESEGFESVDAATNIQAFYIEAVSEAKSSLTTIEEDDTSLKSLDNVEGCQKAYSRDFLLSFQSHPLALERPQSKDPSLVLPEVNLMALQMLKDFPNSHHGWTQECQDTSVTGMIKWLKSQAVIRKEPQRGCSVLDLLALKHEYIQFVPTLQPWLPPPVMDSFNEALSSVDTILCPEGFDSKDNVGCTSPSQSNYDFL